MAVYLLAQSAKPASWPSQGAERAMVTLTQYAVRPRDHDNLAASFKPGLDALTRAGIIIDDRPSVIDLSLRAVKVKHEADECVLVRIERIDEHEWCYAEFHRCDGGGPGEHARF